MSGNPRDPWALLGARTPARIALGRAGGSLPTREVLAFALAHARARDAVHAVVDWVTLAGRLRMLGIDLIEAGSLARDRQTYLRQPDRGRRLDAVSRTRLGDAARAGTYDLAIVIGDGLSATAVAAHAAVVVEALLPHLARLGLVIAPVVLAEGARVALGDEIGLMLGCKLVVVLIGERPGLSAADSLGAYITFDPRPGRTDAERNCISNIRPDGLDPSAAAANLAWLIAAAFDMGATGVGLKDQSGMGEIPKHVVAVVSRDPERGS